jgi:hypothetical protein
MYVCIYKYVCIVWAGFNVSAMQVRIQIFGVVNVNKGEFLSDISFETSGINTLATEHNKPEELNPSEPFAIHCAVQIRVHSDTKKLYSLVLRLETNV